MGGFQVDGSSKRSLRGSFWLSILGHSVLSPGAEYATNVAAQIIACR